MSKKRNIGLKSKILVAMSTVLTILFPMQVYASEAETAFGSNYYVVRDMEKQLRIGVYIRADEVIGEYHLELRYDNTRLKYVSGADAEEDGLLILEGTGEDMEEKVFFYFEAISGGEAGIAFTGAQVYSADGSELLDITEYDYAPITIQGEDVSGISFVELLQKAENPEGNIEDEIENSERPSMKEEDSAEIPVMAEEEEPAEEVSADVQAVEKENKSSAAQIYEQSKQLTVENNRGELLERFIYVVILLVAVFPLSFLFVKKLNRVRKKQHEVYTSDSQEEPFSFEYEKIAEESDAVEYINLDDMDQDDE